MNKQMKDGWKDYEGDEFVVPHREIPPCHDVDEYDAYLPPLSRRLSGRFQNNFRRFVYRLVGRRIR